MAIATTMLGSFLGEAVAVGGEDGASLRPVQVKAVSVNDHFWAPKQKVIRRDTIPHSWPYVEPSIEEFRRLATPGRPPVEKHIKWGEANLYKVLETVAYALAQEPDAALDRKADEVIAIIAAAQRPDGYLHAWSMARKLRPWDDLYLRHEGFVCGHLYEAAAAHFLATGKKNLLEVACRSADFAWEHFVHQQNAGFCGHAGMELGLVELYRVTGNKKYVELAQAFIERRGQHPERAVRYPPAYFQDDLPVRQQQSINGHAVRAVFFTTGVADLALETGDRDMRAAAHRLWESATQRKMYITGSVGSESTQEAFGPDYELPNNGYTESCAACGMANLAHRMLRLEGNASAADELERVVYNGMLHGMALDGKSSYYQNPLSDRNRLRNNNWTCCPPNLSRTVLLVGKYAYAYSDDRVYVNLFVGGTGRIPLPKTPVALDVQTDYPWQGTVKIGVEPERPAEFALCVRIPGWCRGATARLNGAEVKKLELCKGYAVFRRRWVPHDAVVLELPLPVMRMEAHPAVQAARGKVAIQRGPLVYGLEGLDNEGLSLVNLGADPQFRVEYRPDFLGGVSIVHGLTAEGKPFVAIPFYALGNRGKSSQDVWMNQQDKRENRDGWQGTLYREYRGRPL